MIALGIETSCDETAVAIVQDATKVLSNIVSSQVKLHSPYGGVVPEIAARHHIEVIDSLANEAIKKAGIAWNDIDIVAATYGPGLATSLIVGLNFAKAISLRLNKPFVAVNHIEAHLFSPFLNNSCVDHSDIKQPFLALVVSGGHTCLIKVNKIGDYLLLGTTVDDAAGEAFDKGAALLKLGYPGGPLIDNLAKKGRKTSIVFPKGEVSKLPKNSTLDKKLCFSFSGLKTALANYIKNNPEVLNDEEAKANLAYAFQEAIVEVLVYKTLMALKKENLSLLCIGGGVSLNSRLRSVFEKYAEEDNYRLLLASKEFCIDNAAMVAGLACLNRSVAGEESLNVDVVPDLMI